MSTAAAAMTPASLTVGADVPLAGARCMMSEFGLRFVPVRLEGRLVGLLAVEDALRGPGHHLVWEAMTRQPVIVRESAALAEVAQALNERGADVAIVADGDRVLGLVARADAQAERT